MARDHVVELSSSFNKGAWIHMPVSVAAQGSVSITVTRTGAANAVLGGIFLGDAGPPAAAPPPPPPPATATYYVDAISGNDAYGGKSPTDAWQSLQKIGDAVLAPGDKVLFNRGNVWSGTLSFKRSGKADARILIGSYGSGPLPVIQGGQSCLYVFSNFVTVTEIQTQDCAWGGVDIHGSDNRVE